MTQKQKITPSQDLSWLAGIIDGEGSISCHKLKGRNSLILGVVIVNTDEGILSNIETIYRTNNIFSSRYNRALYNKTYSFKGYKTCYEIVVRRKDDSYRLCKLIKPYLRNTNKKEKVDLLISFIESHPNKTAKVKNCLVCKKNFTGRGVMYCSQKCWHDFAIGTKNPNYKNRV